MAPVGPDTEVSPIAPAISAEPTLDSAEIDRLLADHPDNDDNNATPSRAVVDDLGDDDDHAMSDNADSEEDADKAGLPDAKPEVADAAAKPKKPRIQYPKLNAAALLSAERGLPKLMGAFNDVKWQGKGHEANNLNKLIFYIDRWAKQLHPRWAVIETIERVEELGKKREVKVFAKKVFEDMPTCIGIGAEAGLPPYVLDMDVDEETVPMNRKLPSFRAQQRVDEDEDDEDVFATLSKAIDNNTTNHAAAEDFDAGRNNTGTNKTVFKKRRRKHQVEAAAIDADDVDFAALRTAIDDRPAPLYAVKKRVVDADDEFWSNGSAGATREKMSRKSAAKRRDDDDAVVDPFADFDADMAFGNDTGALFYENQPADSVSNITSVPDNVDSSDNVTDSQALNEKGKIANLSDIDAAENGRRNAVTLDAAKSNMRLVNTTGKKRKVIIFDDDDEETGGDNRKQLQQEQADVAGSGNFSGPSGIHDVHLTTTAADDRDTEQHQTQEPAKRRRAVIDDEDD